MITLPQERFEALEVKLIGGITVEGDALTCDGKVCAGQLPQVREDDAQTRARIHLWHLAPENPGQGCASVRTTGDCKVAEQCRRLVGDKARDRYTVPLDTYAAQNQQAEDLTHRVIGRINGRHPGNLRSL